MHRDFKLANVLKHDGVIKIADFGFAKLLGSEDEQAETILGSPLNMAPEILDHKAYNSKADIWSIGISFYEMLFGKYHSFKLGYRTQLQISSTCSKKSRSSLLFFPIGFTPTSRMSFEKC